MITVSWQLLVIATLIFILGFLFNKLIEYFTKPKPKPTPVAPPEKPIYLVVEKHTIKKTISRGETFRFHDIFLNTPFDLTLAAEAKMREVSVVAVNGVELKKPLVSGKEHVNRWYCYDDNFSIVSDLTEHSIGYTMAAPDIENVTVEVVFSTEYYKGI